MDVCVGIDVSKAGLDVVLLKAERRESQHFTNTPTGFGKLNSWLQRRAQGGGIHVCLEATGQYSEGAAEFLFEQGYLVSVVNPARIKAYGASQLSRNKTDQLDAALIADFCRTQQPDAWPPLPPEVKHLQALVRHLQALTTTRQQAHNRLDNPAQDTPVTDHLQTQIALLDQQIKETKKAIADHLDSHPTLKVQKDLLISIPGLGELTIGKLLAECRDLPSFHARQLVAFAGLNPVSMSPVLLSLRNQPSLVPVLAPYARPSTCPPSLPCVVIPSCTILLPVSVPVVSLLKLSLLLSCANSCIWLLASSSLVSLLTLIGHLPLDFKTVSTELPFLLLKEYKLT